MISLNIKKRFVSDYNLPIKLFDDEMFAYYIDLYDKMHNTKYKYQLLEQSVMTCKGEEGFLKEFNSIKDEIISDISSKESYKRLSDIKIPIAYTPKYGPISSQNIYTPEFVGKNMLSIDLVKANFNSMKCYDSALVNDKETYEDFISDYTTDPYMKESKQLRQVIFGNLLPTKQQSIQNAIIGMITDLILDIMPVTKEVRISRMGTDEIIIHERADPSFYNILWALSNIIPAKLLDIIKIEQFKLLKIHPTKPFYAKVTENKTEFKNVPNIYYPQVYKHFMNMPIEDKDLLFEYEGEPATFVNPLYPKCKSSLSEIIIA